LMSSIGKKRKKKTTEELAVGNVVLGWKKSNGARRNERQKKGEGIGEGHASDGFKRMARGESRHWGKKRRIENQAH